MLSTPTYSPMLKREPIYCNTQAGCAPLMAWLDGQAFGLSTEFVSSPSAVGHACNSISAIPGTLRGGVCTARIGSVCVFDCNNGMCMTQREFTTHRMLQAFTKEHSIYIKYPPFWPFNCFYQTNHLLKK